MGHGAGPARLSTVSGAPEARGAWCPRSPGCGRRGWTHCGVPPAPCTLSGPPGCVCRAITEMAPISSDCWKPAHELSQRVRRVSHQRAVTTRCGTRHEGVLARLPGAQRRCPGTQVAEGPYPAGSGQGQALRWAGALPGAAIAQSTLPAWLRLPCRPGPWRAGQRPLPGPSAPPAVPQAALAVHLPRLCLVRGLGPERAGLSVHVVGNSRKLWLAAGAPP